MSLTQGPGCPLAAAPWGGIQSQKDVTSQKLLCAACDRLTHSYKLHVLQRGHLLAKLCAPE